MKRKTGILILAVAVVAVVIYLASRPPRQIVLTGIVTTDETIVGPEVQGRLQQLFVKEGDSVTNGQLIAVIQPREWQADLAFYASSEAQSTAQVAQAEADLKYQEAQTSNQISQAEATLAATQAQREQAQADLENFELAFQREEDLYRRGVDSKSSYDQARTAYQAAKAHAESLARQVQAAESAVALAKSNIERVSAQRAALEANVQRLAASSAQKEKAEVRLDYTRVHAPISGIVDTRAALQGEIVNPGQAIVTLINPDDLWVRADVEETYIDRIHLGDKLIVKLPSGAKKEGAVFYRGIDADYATQRDVSRTKRDIKTFEIRLRCDNHDRALALGMTAFVTLPLPNR
jgi:HlyD family secretion protein